MTTNAVQLAISPELIEAERLMEPVLREEWERAASAAVETIERSILGDSDRNVERSVGDDNECGASGGHEI